MGLNIGDIVPRKAIEFSDIKGKVIAVDASNIIYQFLSTIRQPDGTPLQDKKGRITSHLSGLFYRNINLLNEGLKLVYVFDGKMPELKKGTIGKREEVKEKAREKYEEARKKEDIESMRKFSQQLAKLTPEIKEESKELLEAMGIQIVQAPSEAEAQASYMAKRRKAFAVASQDYDALLFQTPRLLQNLTLARKRKTISGYVYISPEMIELQKVLNSLQINQDQLICLGILTGTDYNPGGVRGIGQKKALEIVRKKKYPVRIFGSVEEEIRKLPPIRQFDWKEIFELFKKPKVKDIEIKFPKIKEEKVKKILLNRDFSESRVENALAKLNKAREASKQRTLF
jgi:flap endonuclease-1